MSGRHIENRTLGELAAMRDTLAVARRELVLCGSGDRAVAATLRIVDVLDSIVQGTPFQSTADVRAMVAGRPRRRT